LHHNYYPEIMLRIREIPPLVTDERFSLYFGLNPFNVAISNGPGTLPQNIISNSFTNTNYVTTQAALHYNLFAFDNAARRDSTEKEN
jgi:hypothetical protein